MTAHLSILRTLQYFKERLHTRCLLRVSSAPVHIQPYVVLPLFLTFSPPSHLPVLEFKNKISPHPPVND